MPGTIEEYAGGLIGGSMEDHGILVETLIRPDMLPGKYALIFNVMKHLYSIGANPDFGTLYMTQELSECRDVLNGILESGFSSANWKYYQKEIVELWSKRKLITLGHLLASSNEESKDVINKAEEIILEISNVSHGNQIQKVEDYFETYLKRMEERQKNRGNIPGISWGLPTVDSCTLGAQPGQLVVIGGRPSEGKSAIAVQIMQHQGMVLNNPVGIISIESSGLEVVSRFISGGSKVDGMNISMGMTTRQEMTDVGLFMKRFYELNPNIFIFDRPGISLSEIRSAARRMVINNGIKVLFVDYLQLVHVEGKKDRTEEVQSTSLGLKEIARELGICVVALAQLKRDEKNARPTMASVQHSSQIEQDADQLWLLYHKRNDDGSIAESRIIIEKVRDGQTADIFVKFDKKIVTFIEVPRPVHDNLPSGGVKL